MLYKLVSHEPKQSVSRQGVCEGGAYYTFIYLCCATPFGGHDSADKSSPFSFHTSVQSFISLPDLYSSVLRLLRVGHHLCE